MKNYKSEQKYYFSIAQELCQKGIDKETTAALMKVAYFDELCQCPNLAKFKLDVQKFIDEHPGEGVLMTKFDIRQFKFLNKILGKRLGIQFL